MNHKEFYREQVRIATGNFPVAGDGMTEGEFGALCKIAVPQTLKDYYLVAGRHEISSVYNIFLSPDNLAIHDGHLWFMEENQAVCHWGIGENDLGQPDPEVWQLHTDLNGKFTKAYSEERTFSEFVSSYFTFLKDG